MLHKKQYKKIVAIVLVVVMMFGFSNTTYAEINKDYYDINKEGLEVVDSALNEKISGSGLLNAIGLLVYSVGSMMEWVLGGMYKMIAGQAIFPWADAIVFNAIPLLDINFFNPTREGGGSFLYIIKGTLQSLYSTVFGIAISFFSIAVMVMAIKMVISTIASEKAKYKQAIMQWAIGLLLLFVIHYAMSFIFYLNEQLVQVASDIASVNIEKSNAKIVELSNTKEYSQQKVSNFISVMLNETFNVGDLMFITGGVFTLIAVVVLSIIAFGGTASLGMAALFSILGTAAIGGAVYTNVNFNKQERVATYNMYNAYMTKREDKIAEIAGDVATSRLINSKITWEDRQPVLLADVAADLLDSDVYVNTMLGENLRKDNQGFWDTGDNGEKYVKSLYYDTASLIDGVIDLEVNDKKWYEFWKKEDIMYVPVINIFRAVYVGMGQIPYAERVTEENYKYMSVCGDDGTSECKKDDINFNEEAYNLSKVMCDVYDRNVLKQASKVNLLTNLASYFKKAAWTTTATGWTASKSVIQNALMYAILVVQSLILFIAYVKRLFYVTILAMLAPVVVVVDFFNKA